VSAEYHKINSIQKRFTEGPSKGRFTGEWVDPLYEYLQDLDWVLREKIDGTNIRVGIKSKTHSTGTISGVLNFYEIDPGLVRSFDGRTGTAQIPSPLFKRLEELFPEEKLLARFADDEGKIQKEITLCGEGFGAGVQKGGDYGPIDFILFDVQIGGFWLDQPSVADIAVELGCQWVPYFTATLRHAIELVSSHRYLSKLRPGEAEGIVAIPAIPLFNKFGERVIVKIKGKDYPHG